MIDMSQIEKMSPAERLRAMELLWDALARESPEMPSPEWHAQVLEDRRTRAQDGDARFLTMEQLRARLRAGGQ